MAKTTLINIIHAAIDLATSYEAKIEEARKALKGKSPEEIREILLPIVAASPKYNVPVIDGERKAKGKKVLDKAHPKYETCRSMLSDLVADIVGKTSAKAEQEELGVPKHIAALAKQLAEACAEYEQARKLASTALANAFAK